MKTKIHTTSTFRTLLLVLTLLLQASCQEFLDVNENTDLPAKAPSNLLLPPILGLMAVNCYEQGETTAYFTQQLATHSGYNRVKDRWDYSQVTRVGLFRKHYFDVGNNAKNLIEKAKKEGNENYEGIGHVMMVFSWQTATDLFGQMPYYEAMKGNPSPPYDTQQEIYTEVLKQIDEAIELLNTKDPSDRPITITEDRVYQGSMGKWSGFAHAVKARLLLHQTPHINQNYQAIIDEVDVALANWSDPYFKYSTQSDATPYEKNAWGPSRSRPSWDYITNILGESAPTPFMLESVMGYNPDTDSISDPRMPLMMKPNALGKYLSIATSRGKETLIDKDDYPDLYDTYYTSDSSSIPYMTLEELYFIKAEAAFKSGDKSMAFSSFKDGVASHMNRVGVEQTAIIAFLSGGMMPANASALTLSHIMMQKWLALYLQAEAWVDMRRYQYDPQVYIGLKRPERLASFWANDDTQWIQRIAYDNQTEEIYNKPELERLGAFQNPEWLKVKLWWAGGSE